ncbi:bifunctional DNA-formamidopyrimidine glycosylase/DNA-(apurinic or apyrimidinic site) lyase [Candidatus Berkelbacteria bacterium]|nr:bifunctional DNA-formamidopyrimidine glycosylase/DNA-(apurinic or apyrimidinic site) lyase [Candidatus Berkelbacteria bacterium]
MPELPEVEILRRGLAKAIVGKTIKDIEVRHRKSFLVGGDDIIGAKVKSVGRRAKLLYLPLSNNKSLVIHLKLTGQLIYTKNGPGSGGLVGGHPQKVYDQVPPHKHTHVIIEFTDGSHLYFNDLRKFGWMKVVDSGQETRTMAGELGVEPFSEDFNAENLRRYAERRGKMPIKQFLMDQNIIAGIGNIYSDEILWCARVLPTRKSADVTGKEWQAIVRCTPEILNKAIAVGGTSFSSFRHLSGSKGKFYEIVNAYQRTGQPCNRKDGGVIERKKMGGRSAHYCPVCQI